MAPMHVYSRNEKNSVGAWSIWREPKMIEDTINGNHIRPYLNNFDVIMPLNVISSRIGATILIDSINVKKGKNESE